MSTVSSVGPVRAPKPAPQARPRPRLAVEPIVFRLVNTLFLLGLALFTLYPFWNTVVVSLNQSADTIRGGLYFWPRMFSFKNYEAVFVTGAVPHAFMVSVARTVLSTVLNLFLTGMLAYSLSRKEFVFRKAFTTIIVLTMYVNAGLIPQYFLIKSLGLINTFWVYIVPGLVGAFNFIVIRTYISGIPDSLVESARIDGAGEFRIFVQVILPLLTPVMATVALFVAVGNWNSWFDTMLYASAKQDLSTLQYELMRILSASMNQSKSAADIGSAGMAKDLAASLVAPVSLRAAVTVVAALPILLVYPFLQRHFVTGLTVGGVKE